MATQTQRHNQVLRFRTQLSNSLLVRAVVFREVAHWEASLYFQPLHLLRRHITVIGGEHGLAYRLRIHLKAQTGAVRPPKNSQ